MNAGVTWINNYNFTHVELPWRGNKHTGMGSRAMALELEEWGHGRSCRVSVWRSVMLSLTILN